MHPDLEKMAELLEEIEQEKDDKVVQSEGFSHDAVPAEMQRRYDTLVSLRKRLADLAKTASDDDDKTEASKEDADESWDIPVFDPTARELIDALNSQEDSLDKRLLKGCGEDDWFDFGYLLTSIEKYPHLFREGVTVERAVKANAVHALVAETGWSGERATHVSVRLQRMYPKIDFTPLRRESLFELMRQGKWREAFVQYDQDVSAVAEIQDDVDHLLTDLPLNLPDDNDGSLRCDKVTNEHLVKLPAKHREALALCLDWNDSDRSPLHPFELEEEEMEVRKRACHHHREVVLRLLRGAA